MPTNPIILVGFVFGFEDSVLVWDVCQDVAVLLEFELSFDEQGTAANPVAPALLSVLVGS
jgi:hypothetical protein